MLTTHLRKGGQYLLMLVVLVFSASCSEDTDRLTPVKYETLESIMFTKDVTLDDAINVNIQEYGITPEFLDLLLQKLNLFRLIAVDLTAYGVRYHTVAPDGTPIVASGVVYYPKNTNPRGVLEISPINKSKHGCVSRNVLTAEVVIATLGYICIIPDLIGCGSTDDLPISYMQHENAAQVSADLRRAAAELIRNAYGKTMPSESTLLGYSLGGSISWALARHYAKHPELGVNVEDIYIGGGAYDPSIALKTFISTRYSQYAVLPNIIYSMDYYDKLSLDFSKIFKGELLENYQEWCTGSIPIAQLTQRLGVNMEDYLDFSFFTDDNPDMNRLMQTAASKAIPNDWRPSERVHLYCAKEDSYVPRQCSDELYKYLLNVGAKVEYNVMDGDHVEGAIKMFEDVAGKIALSRTK